MATDAEIEDAKAVVRSLARVRFQDLSPAKRYILSIACAVLIDSIGQRGLQQVISGRDLQ